MKQIRKRFTYANVMSTIAVFLVLGGASALAASQLGKNTVGSKQLKSNSVTGAKIKNEAITNAKIKKGTITGSSLNLGTLGTVPSATTAATATNAANAANADKLGGKPAAAYQTTIRWAIVSSTGSILRQSGGATADLTSAGIYEVNFGANVSNGAISANELDSGTAGGATSIMSCADSGSSGFSSCTAGVNPNVVKIVTTNTSGAITSRSFYVTVAG